MLQIRNLNVTMKKDLRQLVKDFTFALGPGDKVAIIGEEGNGKSTLLKLLYDPALVEGYVEYTGTIQRDGTILAISPKSCPRSRQGFPPTSSAVKSQPSWTPPPGSWQRRPNSCASPWSGFMQTGRCPPFPAGRR